MRKRHDILESLSDGQVAQLVEHATENRSVGGSIPSLATNLRSDCRRSLPTIARQSVRERRWALTVTSRATVGKPPRGAVMQQEIPVTLER